MGLWYEEKIERYSCSNRQICRKFVSEFLGMFAFVLIACGTVATVTFYKDSSSDSGNSTAKISYDSGDIFYINFGIAIGYTLGLYISIENDGYLNLALTILFWFLGKIKKNDVLPYLLAQFFGALLSAILIWALYYDKIKNFEDSSTSLIFCSSVNGENNGIAVLDQFLKSMLFTIGLMAIIDEQKKTEKKDEPLKTIKPPKSFEPLMIGLVLFLVGIAFSYRSLFYFNPLQDLGGRMVTVLAGCGENCSDPWWWPLIPVFVPVFGSFAAAFMYILCIENNHPKSSEHSSDGDEGAALDAGGDVIIQMQSLPTDPETQTSTF